MLAKRETAIDCARAVFQNRCAFRRNGGLQIVFSLLLRQQGTFDEGDRFFQHRKIAGHTNVKRGDVWQP